MCDFVQIDTSTFKIITLRVIGTNVVISSGIFISIKQVCETLGINQKIVSISDEGGALQNRQKGDILIKKNVSPNKTMAMTPFLRKYLVLFEIKEKEKEIDLNSICAKLMSLVRVELNSSSDSSNSDNSDSSNSDSSESSISSDPIIPLIYNGDAFYDGINYYNGVFQ